MNCGRKTLGKQKLTIILEEILSTTRKMIMSYEKQPFYTHTYTCNHTGHIPPLESSLRGLITLVHIQYSLVPRSRPTFLRLQYNFSFACRESLGTRLHRVIVKFEVLDHTRTHTVIVKFVCLSVCLCRMVI